MTKSAHAWRRKGEPKLQRLGSALDRVMETIAHNMVAHKYENKGESEKIGSPKFFAEVQELMNIADNLQRSSAKETPNE